MSNLTLIPNLISDYVNIKDKGAKGDGFTDDTTAIQAAIDEAWLLNKAVYLPAGEYITSSTLTYKAPMYGEANYSVDYVTPDGAHIKCSINNDTACIRVDGSQDYGTFWTIKNIHFRATGANSIGIEGYNVDAPASGSAAHHFNIEDCRVRLFKTGIKIDGFNGTIKNTDILASTLVGLQLTVANSVSIYGGDIQGSDATGVILETSGTRGCRNVNFYGVAIQNDADATGPGIQIKEGVENVNLNGCYFEFSAVPTNNENQIEIGKGGTGLESDSVQGVSILNCGFSRGHIDIDNAKGLTIDNCTGGAAPGISTVKTTSRTRNLKGAIANTIDSSNARVVSAIIDSGIKIAQPMYNIAPNPSCIGGVGRGWYNLYNTANVSVSQESTITRNGINSIKVEQTASGTYPRAKFQLPNQSWLIANMEGRRFAVALWVYIPDITNFANGTYAPLISPSYRNDGTEVTGGFGASSFKDFMVVDNWHRVYAYNDIPAPTGTGLSDFAIYISPTASSAATTEYIFISDITVVIDPTNDEEMLNGTVPPHPEWPKLEGPLMVGYGTAAPSDASIYAAVGDKVWNTAPTAGTATDMGWVCTTAGSPGTWKAFGDIAA